MSISEKKKIVIAIAMGLAFTIGLGIGVQLYAVTNESQPNEGDRSLIEQNNKK